MSVSVIGTQNSGKSTFVGLLYQAMELRANRDEGSFRFFVPPDSAEKALNIRNTMLQGAFPAHSTGDADDVMSFLIGFRAKTVEKARMLQSLKRIGGKDFMWMVLSIYEIPPEQIFGVLGGGRNPFAADVPLPGRKANRAFNTTVLVVIVDASALTLREDGHCKEALMKYDSYLAWLLEHFMENRRKARKKVPLNIVFVFTKGDLLEAGIREKYNTSRLVQQFSPEISDDVGKNLVADFLPKTCKGVSSMVSDERIRHFFSYIGWEPYDDAEKMQSRLKVYRPEDGGGQVRNVFPDNIYDALLDHLGSLSSRYFDPEEMVKKMRK